MRLTLIAAFTLATFAGCTCPGQPCTAPGSATVTVTSSGLPSGVQSRYRVTTAGADGGSQDVVGDTSLSVAAGFVDVNPQLVTQADPLVRSVYLSVSNSSACVVAGSTETFALNWAKVPTSNRLWVSTRNATADLVGFDASGLRASATLSATVASTGPVGGAIAFDPQGNLWAIGATTSDPTLVRFPASALATSGALTPDTKIDVSFGCVPLARALAFDAQGNAWVSSPCRDAVFMVSASELTPGGTIANLTPSRVLTVTDPGGLAFDASGNLWVASATDGRVLRFDAAALAAAGPSTMPALKLGVFATTIMGDTSRFSPAWLAFDANGDLWANDFAANTFFRVPKAQLAATGTVEVQPAVRVVVGVLAVLEGFAFDESGGLWSAGAQGRVIRLSPTQLTVSSTTGSPTTPETIIQSGDIGSAANLAIYPAPAGTALRHALP